ncbi:MAG: translation initiation factor IF-3 [Candidatus Cloacimonetes bacterium]|nr:translation initiation factor IF-3 [Candidatus Cloacimonadota bacterium]MDD2649677.1 translation initiation factor IF-3 [Candidatus Cloacimonadota bacterium]
MRRGKSKTKAVVPKERINTEIDVAEVRLISNEGCQIGIVSLQRALQLAEEAGLDLVEISPNANPPVCRILDFSKYYYHKERKARELKKKQHVVLVKEIKFGPNTDDHDYNFKKNNAIRFLKQQNKVKFTVRFKGRQMAHKELGYDVLERIAEDLKDIIEIDSKPSSEKNLLTMVVSPKKEIDRIIEKLESVDTEPMENEEIIDE